MAKQNNNRRKKQEYSPEQAIVEGFFRGVGQVVVWTYKKLTQTAGKVSGPDKAELDKLQEHWQDVEMHVLQEQTRSVAISEGDKILDSAFKVYGFPGETMADRLKAAETRFSAELYQRIWQAHKLRNTLAHEIGARASAEEARQAIAAFRQALYQLGVLS